MSSWPEVFSEVSSSLGKEYLLETVRIAIRTKGRQFPRTTIA